jgi:hypothetical protein
MRIVEKKAIARPGITENSNGSLFIVEFVGSI